MTIYDRIGSEYDNYRTEIGAEDVLSVAQQTPGIRIDVASLWGMCVRMGHHQPRSLAPARVSGEGARRATGRLTKLLPPNSVGVVQLAAQTGIPRDTLYGHLAQRSARRNLSG